MMLGQPEQMENMYTIFDMNIMTSTDGIFKIPRKKI